MSITTAAIVLLVGLVIGIIGGMVGIGGGVLVIPVLMVGFGFSQVKANGTSLAMLLPPIGIFAVMAYARAGNIDWRFAILLAAGFTLGAYAGARLVNSGRINITALRLLFAMLLLYIACRMLFQSGGRARSALETSALIGAIFATYVVMRLLGRHWSTAQNWGEVYRSKRHENVEFDYEI